MMDADVLNNKHSVLKVNEIFVNNIQLSVTNSINPVASQEKVNASCQFKYTIRYDESNYVLVVSAHVTAPELKEFDLKIDVTGIFTIDRSTEQNDVNSISNDKLLSQNAIAILFPFIRMYIVNISHMSGVQGIIVPVFNIAAAVAKAKEQKTDEQVKPE